MRQAPECQLTWGFCCAPGRTRTCDPLLRRQPLCPSELQAPVIHCAGSRSHEGHTVLTGRPRSWPPIVVRERAMPASPFVTPGGAEIGRAQAMQAAAAGIEPDARMNPVLLKPGSDTRTHVVVLGQPDSDVGALEYRGHSGRLLSVALDCLAQLRAEFDVVICEGAGSPAEINLRDTDIANMGLARAANLPVVVVGDIDRGGVFASFFGTIALLNSLDQALISGFVINKFRGDPSLLEPGLRMLRGLTGRPTLGVLPWREGLALDLEDSLALDRAGGTGIAREESLGNEVLRVSVVRLPRISN